MGEVRDSRRRGQALLASVRDSSEVQQHVESAGDLLIKQLVQKQTNVKTSLQEQLGISQNFVREPQPGSSSSSGKADFGVSTVEQLKEKTGLSREELEEILSVKPNSTVSRLYRFALSNQRQQAIPPDLVSLLQDHPLNNLKAIEEDFLKNIESSVNNKDGVVANKRRKKHRTRKKKVLVEQTCEPGVMGKANSCEEEEIEDIVVETSNISNEDRARKRPSLWDVKDMGKFGRESKIGCNPQKLYTVREGKIVEVEDNTSPHIEDVV